MRQPSDDFLTYTVTLPTPVGKVKRVCLALTHQGKNIGNTSVFLIRQVFSAYSYDAETKMSTQKETLHPSQVEAICHFNTHITLINAKRRQSHEAKITKALEASEKEPVLKLVLLLTSTMDSVAKSILDATVLDNAVKNWKTEQGNSVYRRLPAAMSQQVIGTVRDDFSSFFKGIARFNKNCEDMTGRPRMPGYRDKPARSTIEIPIAQVHTYLPSIKCDRVPEDYAETLILPADVIAAFSDFDVNALIAKACQGRGWQDYKPQHLRIVPLRNSVKMEVVVRVKHAYPTGSFLAGLESTHGPFLSGMKTSKERDAWLFNRLTSLPATEMPRCCGIDPGVKNIASVAYSTGHHAEVHTGGRFEKIVSAFTDKIGALVSASTPPRAKELQAKKLILQKQKQKLPMDEHIELNTLLKPMYASQAYLTLIERKKNWTETFLHTLSHNIVKRCVEKRIDVIVIGQNKLWKQKSNMGKEQNRRFGQTAHATLIRMISYKAEAYGIAVVTTEESYTSQASFVNNDELEKFDKTQRFDKSTPRPVKSGKRSRSDRNRFVNKNRIGTLSEVQADVNGAFNILRKVFKDFQFHMKLSMKHTLLRLSSRLGVTKLHNFG
jgi:putative transposase